MENFLSTISLLAYEISPYERAMKFFIIIIIWSTLLLGSYFCQKCHRAVLFHEQSNIISSVKLGLSVISALNP